MIFLQPKVSVQLTISILPRSTTLMFPPIWTQKLTEIPITELTAAAAKSRSEHHIPLSTSSLGSWKSAVEGARRFSPPHHPVVGNISIGPVCCFTSVQIRFPRGGSQVTHNYSLFADDKVD